ECLERLAAYARTRLRWVSELARLVSERPLAAQESMPAAETPVSVSSTIFSLSGPALSWRACRSLLGQAAAKTREQAWLVRRAPVHSAPGVEYWSESRQVREPERLVLPRPFGGTPRSVAQPQNVPVI